MEELWITSIFMSYMRRCSPLFSATVSVHIVVPVGFKEPSSYNQTLYFEVMSEEYPCGEPQQFMSSLMSKLLFTVPEGLYPQNHMRNVARKVSSAFDGKPYKFKNHCILTRTAILLGCGWLMWILYQSRMHPFSLTRGLKRLQRNVPSTLSLSRLTFVEMVNYNYLTHLAWLAGVHLSYQYLKLTNPSNFQQRRNKLLPLWRRNLRGSFISTFIVMDIGPRTTVCKGLYYGVLS